MPSGIQAAEKYFFRFPCPGMDIGYFIENRFQGGLNRFIVILGIKDLIFTPIMESWENMAADQAKKRMPKVELVSFSSVEPAEMKASLLIPTNLLFMLFWEWFISKIISMQVSGIISSPAVALAAEGPTLPQKHLI